MGGPEGDAADAGTATGSTCTAIVLLFSPLQDFVRLRKAMSRRDVSAVEETLKSISLRHASDDLVAFEDEVVCC